MLSIRRALAVTLLTCSTLAAPQVTQASQTFTTEAAFRTALGITPSVHNFDSFAHNTTMTTQLAGVNYQSTARAWDALSQGGGGTYQTPINVLLNFGAAPINFLLTPPVDGVGFYNTSIFDAERVSFFDSSNNLLFQADLPAPVVNFRAYIGDVKIARVSVVGIPPTNGTIFIDTVIFGNVDPTTPTLRSSWSKIKQLYRP